MIDRIERGNIVVSVPAFRGTFELDIRSDLARRFLRTGAYESELAHLVERFLNTECDAIDVGANIGFFSVLFSKLTSDRNRVLSIEPTPHALEFLRPNVQLNCCADKVVIFEGVVVDRPGTFILRSIDGKEEYSTLGALVHPSIKDLDSANLHVQGQTIDELVRRFNLHPGFIKIDTEGAENLVLIGGLETVRRFRPVILCELSDSLLKGFGSSVKTVVTFLEGETYKVVDTRNMKARLSYPFEGDILAIPVD